MATTRPLVLGLLFFIAACRSSSPAGVDAGASEAAAPSRLASCDRSFAAGTCSEYDGAYLAQNENLLTTSCKRLGGTFVVAECPNTAIVGACKLSTGESRKYYDIGTSGYAPDRARKECEGTLHGAWQPR